LGQPGTLAPAPLIYERLLYMDRLRRIGISLALTTAIAAVATGCGGESTDVSGGVDALNKRLSDQGIAASLDCPKEVDGGEGTDFECTLSSDDGSTEEKVQMEVQKERGELVVDVADAKAWGDALQKVGGRAEGAPDQDAAPEEETP
jgi:hypothetical protein